MKDFYKNTRECIDKYNQILDKISTCSETTTEEEDEFLDNLCLYLAHSLIKDHGCGAVSRDVLSKAADIINDTIR